MADTLDLDPEFGAIDLVEELEAVFDFRMSDEEGARCYTVGDVYEVVRAHTTDWDELGGNCGSSLIFYRFRQALNLTDKRSMRPATSLATLGLPPGKLFRTLGKGTGLRLPAHPLTLPGRIGCYLLLAFGIAAIVGVFNALWMIAGACAMVTTFGVALIWIDPGHFPDGVSSVGDLVRRTVPLNAERLMELGGKPADRWSILTALAAEYGQLRPDEISPETFLHKKSLEEAVAA